MAGFVSRWTFKGSFPSGENFQYAMCVVRADAEALTLADSITACDAWVNALKTGGTPLAGQYTTDTTWAAAQVDIIDPSTGRYTERGFGTATFAGTIGGSVPSLPPSVAVCVTLRTNIAGESGRGRFYLPAPSTNALQRNGRMADAALSAFAGSLANGFTVLNGLTNPIYPAVLSRKDGVATPCNKGDIGNVFDGMRTRRDKLVEKRSQLFVY